MKELEFEGVEHKFWEPELIVDGQVQMPQPLDRRIASIALRTKANDPTEGYDVTLSASFGTERVTLSADEIELSVTFSIKTADIELKFVRCDHSISDAGDPIQSEEWNLYESAQFESGTGTESSASGRSALGIDSRQGVTVEATIAAKYAAKSQTHSNQKLRMERSQRDWHRMGTDAIKVGRTGKPLDGPAINDFTGWHVKPHRTDCKSGVIARIIVREDWIQFDKVELVRTPDRLKAYLNKVLSTESSRRKNYFILLLKHLAQLGLQTTNETRDATVAMSAVVVKPGGQRSSSIQEQSRLLQIKIPADPIETFLFSEEGYEGATLVGLGVRKEFIPIENSGTGDRLIGRRKNLEVFVPQSTPTKTIRTLAQIQREPGQSRSAVEKFAGRNEIRDLRALGLVIQKKGKVYPANELVIDPEITLRRAVSLMPAIKAARAVLISNPGATATSIADAVAVQIGKDWSNKGTKQRHGAAIKFWTAWVEPHLIDPTHSSEAATLLASVSAKTLGPGRRNRLNETTEPLLRKFAAEGLTVREIAERMNVSHGAVQNWMQDLKIPRKYGRREKKS